jgi:hypothetical protein
MPSITSWLRLEPRSRRDSIDIGLQARIHDPLWLLGRQWQLNEFKGDDAGSPVAAHLEGDAFQLTRCFSGDLPASGTAVGQPLDPSAAPLETIVQREPYAHAASVDLRFAADAGRYFVRLLEGHRVQQYAPAYLKLYPLQAPSGLDEESARFAAAIAGRAIDGPRLYGALKSADPALPPIDVNDQQLVDSATRAWIQWYQTVVSEPAGTATTWIPGRMEYSLAVSAATPEGEIVLEAPDYRGGALDWYAFRARPGAALGSSPAEMRREPLTRTVIPAPVKYPGMPSERWWEFEDSRVDFGAVDTLPGDMAALVLLQFAVTYGNDWFLVPLPLSVGSLCRIATLNVTDSFGVQAAIPPFSKTSGAADSWRMFTVSGSGDADLLFVPPSVEGALQPRKIETVLLARDEMANMGWAIEKKVLDAAGRVVDRTRAPQQPQEMGGTQLTYGLVTAVPGNWIPLVPVSDQGTTRIRLRRAAMAVTGAPPPHALGAIIGAPGALIINDEEVPRSGATVTRSIQYARWLDGSTHLWAGRRNEPGQGEANSGLQFDTARGAGAS